MIHCSEFLLKRGKLKGEKTSSFHPTGTIFLLSTRSPEFLTAIKLVDVTWDDRLRSKVLYDDWQKALASLWSRPLGLDLDCNQQGRSLLDRASIRFILWYCKALRAYRLNCESGGQISCTCITVNEATALFVCGKCFPLQNVYNVFFSWSILQAVNHVY